MPRVLFLADSLSNGGAERQLVLLAKHLQPKWECMVWSMGRGPFEPILRDNGINVNIRTRSWRWDGTPAINLWHFIRHWKPDIIHSFGWMGALAAILPAKFYQIPLIDGTIRQANIPVYRGKIWRWSLQFANRVIANSQAGLQAFHIDLERGRVVHNGFDPQRLELCKRMQKEKDTKFTVVMVGRMVPEKDFPTYFEVARKFLLHRQGSKWAFGVIGSGPKRAEWMKECKDLVDGRVMKFYEPTLEVLPIVQCADVGVLLTSLEVHEGISNAVMEYMACELPVICTDSGGNQELVEDRKTGFIIAPGDVEQLEDKLHWLRQHPVEASLMGAAGRQRILDEFSVEQLVQNTVSVYKEVL
jgi:glycosyltransferase involved in cell wall biosynthesis